MNSFIHFSRLGRHSNWGARPLAVLSILSFLGVTYQPTAYAQNTAISGTPSLTLVTTIQPLSNTNALPARSITHQLNLPEKITDTKPVALISPVVSPQATRPPSPSALIPLVSPSQRDTVILAAPSALESPLAESIAKPARSEARLIEPTEVNIGLNPDATLKQGLNLPVQTLSSIDTTLWERMRKGFSIPNLDTSLAMNKTLWYARQPDYITRMTERSGRYLFYIVEELERRAMPTEIALLPFVESAFNPQAISSAKAAGIWQFMPATGKNFNLKQNVWRDERRGVVESTRAALDYLQKLHTMFGDWHLALAAYNWGEGSVQRAINKNRAKGLATDYVSLNMPNETANYVPKFQAIKNIIQNPETYGIRLSPLANAPYFASVIKDRDIDVSLAAKFAGMSLGEFKALNPGFKKPVILGAHRPEILLPADRLGLFNEAMSNYKGILSSWTTVTLSGTEKPAAFAKRYGMNEQVLREINNIPPRMLLKSGSTLIVPKNNLEAQSANISAHLDNAQVHLAPELVRRSVMVHKKETWAKLAARTRMSAASLQNWNRNIGKLRKGMMVIYYTSPDAPAAAEPAPEPVEGVNKRGKHSKTKITEKSSKRQHAKATVSSPTSKAGHKKRH
jgi:membrane-bound lytic murein transglycosylase D